MHGQLSLWSGRGLRVGFDLGISDPLVGIWNHRTNKCEVRGPSWVTGDCSARLFFHRGSLSAFQYAVRANQCILLRNSTMKLIHPTAIVTMPIAMQRSDAVQIVPATIQTTPAKMIARETRYSRTLPFITRYT